MSYYKYCRELHAEFGVQLPKRSTTQIANTLATRVGLKIRFIPVAACVIQTRKMIGLSRTVTPSLLYYAPLLDVDFGGVPNKRNYHWYISLHWRNRSLKDKENAALKWIFRRILPTMIVQNHGHTFWRLWPTVSTPREDLFKRLRIPGTPKLCSVHGTDWPVDTPTLYAVYSTYQLLWSLTPWVLGQLVKEHAREQEKTRSIANTV